MTIATALILNGAAVVGLLALLGGDDAACRTTCRPPLGSGAARRPEGTAVGETAAASRFAHARRAWRAGAQSTPE